jgi:extracellular elastinolytic metalloproteinase
MSTLSSVFDLGDTLGTLVTDGLKLSPGNPTFLDARDGILLALDQLRDHHRISQDVWKAVRKVAWQGFAHSGMGVNAASTDAELISAVAGTSLPADL